MYEIDAEYARYWKEVRRTIVSEFIERANACEEDGSAEMVTCCVRAALDVMTAGDWRGLAKAIADAGIPTITAVEMMLGAMNVMAGDPGHDIAAT